MKKSRLLGAVYTCLAAVSFNANAAFVSLDDPVHGVDALTFDDVSGLTWLDVSVTAGMTYNQVSGQLGAGGDFEGFRYATGVEVEQLLISAGIGLDTGWTAENVDPINHFIDNYIGDTGNPSFTSDASAVYGDVGEYQGHKRVFIRTQEHMGAGFASLTSGWQYDNANEGEGHMLVIGSAVATVPVPAAVWLFGSGLLGLVGIARHKKA